MERAVGRGGRNGNRQRLTAWRAARAEAGQLAQAATLLVQAWTWLDGDGYLTNTAAWNIAWAPAKRRALTRRRRRGFSGSRRRPPGRGYGPWRLS